MLILKIGILLILLCLILQNTNRYNPIIGFLVILLIMGFQSNVDGDYMAYMAEYLTRSDSRTADTEPFWNFLANAFGSFASFPVFVFCISLFEVIVLYLFSKQTVENKYAWVGPILFFFTFNLMLIQMKAIRQGLAVELSLLSFLLLDKMKLWKAAIPLVLAYFTHNSCIITFPLFIYYYFLIRQKRQPKAYIKNEWIWPVTMALCIFIIYLAKHTVINKYLMGFASMFASDDFRLWGYFTETENDFTISNVILIYNMAMVFLATWQFQTASRIERVMCVATILASYIEVLFFGMGSLFRMAIYFNVFAIALVPNILKHIDDRYGRVPAFILSLFFVAYSMKTSLPWLTTAIDGRFGDYKLIFM